jgi:hypothetical protein
MSQAVRSAWQAVKPISNPKDDDSIDGDDVLVVGVIGQIDKYLLLQLSRSLARAVAIVVRVPFTLEFYVWCGGSVAFTTHEIL